MASWRPIPSVSPEMDICMSMSRTSLTPSPIRSSPDPKSYISLPMASSSYTVENPLFVTQSSPAVSRNNMATDIETSAPTEVPASASIHSFAPPTPSPTPIPKTSKRLPPLPPRQKLWPGATVADKYGQARRITSDEMMATVIDNGLLTNINTKPCQLCPDYRVKLNAMRRKEVAKINQTVAETKPSSSGGRATLKDNDMKYDPPKSDVRPTKGRKKKVCFHPESTSSRPAKKRTLNSDRSFHVSGQHSGRTCPAIPETQEPNRLTFTLEDPPCPPKPKAKGPKEKAMDSGFLRRNDPPRRQPTPFPHTFGKEEYSMRVYDRIRKANECTLNQIRQNEEEQEARCDRYREQLTFRLSRESLFKRRKSLERSQERLVNEQRKAGKHGAKTKRLGKGNVKKVMHNVT